jgi:hypothetical protein
MSTIIIKESLQEQMLRGFQEEVKENKKLLSSRGLSPFIYQRAEERLRVVESSIEEIKKQMANPYRHAMLQQGINPESEREYRTQLNRPLPTN